MRTPLPDVSEQFRPGTYDVYILGDLEAAAFHGGELGKLAECVNRGAGLIMLGGLNNFGPGGYDNTPLAKLLPVRMDRLERQESNESVRSDLQRPGPLKMRPTSLGRTHFALMLAGNPQENDALWSKLPALDGASKLQPREPGAVVLADAGEDVPLLIEQSFGDGRVMAFAGDTTWRWRMQGFEAAPDGSGGRSFSGSHAATKRRKGASGCGLHSGVSHRRSGWSSRSALLRLRVIPWPMLPTRPRWCCPTGRGGRCRSRVKVR